MFFLEMTVLQNNTIKTVTASFLVALLVFINALKTVHEHHFPYEKDTNTITINVATITAYFSCSICDFQIAKDSDTKIATWQILKSGYHIAAYDDLTFNVPDHAPVTFNVRGPPFNKHLA